MPYGVMWIGENMIRGWIVSTGWPLSSLPLEMLGENEQKMSETTYYATSLGERR